MKRRKRTKRIHLDESIPIFYGILTASFLLLFLVSNRIITSVNLHQRMEIYTKNVKSNTLKLNKAKRIMYNMVRWADKYDEDLYKFYKSVNKSYDLGRPMR